MGSDDWGAPFAYLAVLVIGLLLLIWTFVIIGVVWFSISAVVAAYRYKKYLAEGEREYEQIEMELGATLPVDEVLRATFGAGLELPKDGFTYFDWFEATILGTQR